LRAKLKPIAATGGPRSLALRGMKACAAPGNYRDSIFDSNLAERGRGTRRAL